MTNSSCHHLLPWSSCLVASERARIFFLIYWHVRIIKAVVPHMSWMTFCRATFFTNNLINGNYYYYLSLYFTICGWILFSFLRDVTNVDLTYNYPMHQLMCFSFFKCVDFQCNQIFFPREKSTKTSLTLWNFLMNRHHLNVILWVENLT